MSGFTQNCLCFLSISLPVTVTAAVLPSHEMSLVPHFDKFRSIPCNPISLERAQKFITNVGLSSTGLFTVVVLGPIFVRSVLRWHNRRRRRGQRRLSAIVMRGIEKENVEKESEFLIFGENPDYHGDCVSMETTISPGGPPPHNPGHVRHLRIHSLDELPPPTTDDVSLPHSSWSCPASPVFEPAIPRGNTGRRRSPFNPIVPGMKTTWEEGVDPATGRRWRRKLVVYTSLEIPDETLDKNGRKSSVTEDSLVPAL